MNLPIRFFVIDYDLEDGPDLVEVTEFDFLEFDGKISYKRHSVRENGVSQICLIKE